MRIPDDELIFDLPPSSGICEIMFKQYEKEMFTHIGQSLGVPKFIYSGESSFSSGNYVPMNHRLIGIGGIRFVSCQYMADFVQVRFPRSKKKRIRKKWGKDRRNYRYVPWKKAYQLGDTVFAHPEMIESIRKELA